MWESKLQLAEFKYLYYSLYTYRRKVEADIRIIIKSEAPLESISDIKQINKSKTLYELTQKLRNISVIISNVISLNKGYRKV